MKEDHVSASGEQRGSAGITIELASIIITKTENGYEFTRRNDQIPHHLPDCHDLWDVTDSILHHFRLTPTLLNELYAFRQKCAELHWDDRAVAGFYAGQTKEREAAAPAAKQQPLPNYR